MCVRSEEGRRMCVGGDEREGEEEEDTVGRG